MYEATEAVILENDELSWQLYENKSYLREFRQDTKILEYLLEHNRLSAKQYMTNINIYRSAMETLWSDIWGVILGVDSLSNELEKFWQFHEKEGTKIEK